MCVHVSAHTHIFYLNINHFPHHPASLLRARLCKHPQEETQVLVPLLDLFQLGLEDSRSSPTLRSTWGTQLRGLGAGNGFPWKQTWKGQLAKFRNMGMLIPLGQTKTNELQKLGKNYKISFSFLPFPKDCWGCPDVTNSVMYHLAFASTSSSADCFPPFPLFPHPWHYFTWSFVSGSFYFFSPRKSGLRSWSLTFQNIWNSNFFHPTHVAVSFNEQRRLI